MLHISWKIKLLRKKNPKVLLTLWNMCTCITTWKLYQLSVIYILLPCDTFAYSYPYGVFHIHCQLSAFRRHLPVPNVSENSSHCGWRNKASSQFHPLCQWVCTFSCTSTHTVQRLCKITAGDGAQHFTAILMTCHVVLLSECRVRFSYLSSFFSVCGSCKNVTWCPDGIWN